MSKKSEMFYFNKFIECAEISCEGAELLKEIFGSFNPETLPAKLDLMHAIEHKGDTRKHEMISALAREFITPLERDDIIALSQNIDDVTDSIEDIVVNIYITNVTEINDDCMEFASLISRCCKATRDMLVEFANFKKSKTLGDLIIEINCIEEEGDRMYQSFMRKLHTTEKDALLVIAWREIYNLFEDCCDACEDVADIVQSITIGNT